MVNNDLIQKQFHSFITSLKYREFFASHFIIDANKQAVFQIPTYYFQNLIWETFVRGSDCYYSFQKLDSEQLAFYIPEVDIKKNKRLNKELNVLESVLSGKN